MTRTMRTLLVLAGLAAVAIATGDLWRPATPAPVGFKSFGRGDVHWGAPPNDGVYWIGDVQTESFNMVMDNVLIGEPTGLATVRVLHVHENQCVADPPSFDDECAVDADLCPRWDEITGLYPLPPKAANNSTYFE